MPYCPIRHCPHFKRKTTAENANIKCHRFPTNIEIRRKWEEWVESTNVVGGFKAHAGSGLCSVHFVPENYSQSGRLKKDAIPTVSSELDHEKAFKLGIIPQLLTQPAKVQLPSCSSVHESQPEACEEDCSSRVSSPHLLSLSPSVTSTPSHRREAFIGDLNPSSFQTPRKAKRSLCIIKAQFQKQQKTIKVLQQSLRRSIQTIQYLETLLNDADGRGSALV